MLMACALSLVAACQTKGSVNDVCKILRKPPEFQSETRTAIFKDRPVNVWIASVDMDGKARGCWK